jgi:hypothetical protein
VGQMLGQISADELLKPVPVIVVTTPEQMEEAKGAIGDRPQVAVMPGVPEEKVLADQVAYLDRQMGRARPTAQELRDMAVLAAKGLERLAAMNLKNYNAAKAGEPLVKGAGSADWEFAYECGKVLSVLADAKWQQGLADAAMARSEDPQKIDMLGLLRTSVWRFGNKLTEAQVAALQKVVVEEAKPDLRNAAAGVAGAMNLKPAEARKVVLTKETFGEVVK